MHADVAGYSRLIGLDDAGTLRRLRALREAVIDPAIAAHRGRIVNTAGDSLLIVFDRARYRFTMATRRLIDAFAFVSASPSATSFPMARTCMATALTSRHG